MKIVNNYGLKKVIRNLWVTFEIYLFTNEVKFVVKS